MKPILLATLLILLSSSGQAAGTSKVTVSVRGAHCAACARAIRGQLAKFKGVKFVADDLKPGESPQYFSDPFEMQVGRTLDTGIGAVAKLVAAAKTPHRDDIPPRLNLVLFTDFTIDEVSVSRLREELLPINGVLVNEPGGLGGRPKDGFFWIRLEPAGGAELREIVDGAKKAVAVRLREEE
jgi:copper chaperone CopZ